MTDRDRAFLHERKTSEAGLTELRTVLRALAPPLPTNGASVPSSSPSAAFLVVDDFVTVALRAVATEVKLSALSVAALCSHR